MQPDFTDYLSPESCILVENNNPMSELTKPLRRFPANQEPDVVFQKAVKKPIPVDCVQINEAFEVESMEGDHRGKPGDWLMRGIQGEMYICDREIFEKTYELVV